MEQIQHHPKKIKLKKQKDIANDIKEVANPTFEAWKA
jgi:hypothetical protein